ncbi:hypothetical protein B0I33_110289 [Prauserella shujinwangii]|uniref:Uncharacterized protein n=1 Tax=Prauserella shujinwangii TaxID=1453103 RepID=A0A2T0LPL4_9PSEU|nr:hypothetical protein [Prauserella shujinwangii]PRX45189.1 hypothetical protein B0I33_110289 [Prauserella shujinwangii]
MDVGRPGAAVTGLFTGLLDDAALFPPGEAPLPEAVPAHHDHHAAWYADLVGPFVVSAARLGELAELGDERPLRLSVTLPGGPAELPPALVRLSGMDHTEPVAVEVVLPDDTMPEQLVRVLDEHLPAAVTGWVEVPRGPRREPTLNALAGTRYRAKFRTGGVTAAAHPGEGELAGAIVAAVRRRIPFKCTAGLHHAVRHTEAATGFERHGFLNVLLAADAARRGAEPGEVAALLAERSAETVAERVRALPGPGPRESFVSFGTCSVGEPVDDLVALGLLRKP